MSKLLDTSQASIKLSEYAVAPATALSEPLLLQRVQAYRRQLGARMMALDKVGMMKRIPEGEYFISRKIDGEFTVLIFRDGETLTLNPGGTVRIGLPFIAEAAEKLKAAKIKNAMIVGELYVNRTDKRPRVHDVVRVARNPEKAKDLDSLCFAVFDAIEIDGEEPAQYAPLWKKLGGIFDGKLAHPVETVTGKDAKDIAQRFGDWVEEEGAEGVVARGDAGGLFKIKPRHSLDVAVIGYAEGIEDRTGMLHDLLLAIMRKDGSFQVIGRVGGGFSDEERVNLLSDLQDLHAESEYAEVNSDRVAYQMVRPVWVVEINCLDLVSETTRGGTIDRMVLHWNHKGKTWETVRRMPLVSIISPQFVRIRDDKQINAVDLRIEQLTDLVEVPLADKSTEDLVLPKSELMKRVVATKVLKEKQMVRKLLLWKTNKEGEASDDYPAYVLFFTDFSPNRADPLKRDIRVSDSEDQITTMWNALKEKNFDVRGWNEVS